MSNAKCKLESGRDAPNRVSVRDDKPRNQLKIVTLCTIYYLHLFKFTVATQGFRANFGDGAGRKQRILIEQCLQ